MATDGAVCPRQVVGEHRGRPHAGVPWFVEIVYLLGELRVGGLGRLGEMHYPVGAHRHVSLTGCMGMGHDPGVLPARAGSPCC